MLPNLPETHLTVWGGQAAGIVFAINPMLEPAAIGELLKAGEAKVLVSHRFGALTGTPWAMSFEIL